MTGFTSNDRGKELQESREKYRDKSQIFFRTDNIRSRALVKEYVVQS